MRPTGERPAAASGEAPTRQEALADVRTILAAERTLMAWIRTALAMISFGFAIYKLFGGLERAEAIRLVYAKGPRELGLVLTALGTGSLVAGIIQYRYVLRVTGHGASRLGPAVYVSALVLLLGLLILVDLTLRLGPF